MRYPEDINSMSYYKTKQTKKNLDTQKANHLYQDDRQIISMYSCAALLDKKYIKDHIEINDSNVSVVHVVKSREL